MDDQHKKIAGYRDLSQEEIDLVNELKDLEARVGEVLARVAEGLPDFMPFEFHEERSAGLRWLDLAREHLETGVMYATKAVARPTNGLGRK